jgi:hypothetical protein
MSIENLRKRAWEVIDKKGYQIISDSMIEVKDNDKWYNTKFVTLPGRVIITCSCTNHSRNCNQDAECVHKIVAEHIGMVDFRIRQLKKEEKCQ